jgi:hypothetical protein
MSFVVTQRESLAAAASVMRWVGSTVYADEVSALAATQFATHVPTYQAVDATTGAIHQAFTTTLAVSGEPCVAAEAANPIAAA